MQKGEDPMELNFEGLEMQEWNYKEYRWKTGVICLAILLISRVMVIKMSKMAYFLLMTANI